MEWLIPAFVIASAPRSQRAALTEQLIPVVLPGSNSLRLTFAAISAERQLARQATTDTEVMRDAVKAGVTAATLPTFPALQNLFNGLPEEVQATIFPPPTAESK
ncbi:hypothetical protein SAMN02990966_02197 [Rhodospirillales bacterium URHD0017]|nr:hypothetical protein SAMN02990966_02197 [Rhodospirillales bacterium URHD0017]